MSPGEWDEYSRSHEAQASHKGALRLGLGDDGRIEYQVRNGHQVTENTLRQATHRWNAELDGAIELHAAATGWKREKGPTAGLIIGGAREHGKSTLAVGLTVRCGHRHVADDGVILQPPDRDHTIVPGRTTAWIDETAAMAIGGAGGCLTLENTRDDDRRRGTPARGLPREEGMALRAGGIIHVRRDTTEQRTTPAGATIEKITGADAVQQLYAMATCEANRTHVTKRQMASILEAAARLPVWKLTWWQRGRRTSQATNIRWTIDVTAGALRQSG